MSSRWDYLILTASNDLQAHGYEAQLAVRRRHGLLADVGEVLVVADPGGRRVGSGGSTLYCLIEVLKRQIRRRATAADWTTLQEALRRLRILIIHAGGDSRRVPAYGPCGKIFAPVPGKPAGPQSPVTTLFDRLFPLFRQLPEGLPGAGQTVVAAGDALMLFDPASVRLDRPGLVALGAAATPEAASKHGVFCVGAEGRARCFLQKPSLAEQARYGAIDSAGQSILDLAVMSFDAATAAAMFRAFDVMPGPAGPAFSPEMEAIVLSRGLDLYREICCALGSEATAEHHRDSAVASGSTWPVELLEKIYRELSSVPLNVQVLAQCEFLHFGTTRQLITSGRRLVEYDEQCRGRRDRAAGRPLSLNNRLAGGGRIEGRDAWVEGCRIEAPLRLAGQNVVVGADVVEPLALAEGMCLDVIPGRTPEGRPLWFVRCYHVADTFKDTLQQGATLMGRPLADWLAAACLAPEDVWDARIDPARRSLWDAKVFPAAPTATDYCRWLWMFEPEAASEPQKAALRAAERFSVAQIAELADLPAFFERRAKIHAEEPPCATH